MPKKKLAKKGFDWKDTEKFDKTASEVGGAIENLTNQLNVLNSEIRADKDLVVALFGLSVAPRVEALAEDRA